VSDFERCTYACPFYLEQFIIHNTQRRCRITNQLVEFNDPCLRPARGGGEGCVFFLYDRPCLWCVLEDNDPPPGREVKNKAPCRNVQRRRAAILRALTLGDWREREARCPKD